MDNASKALVMAGAILIALALVGLGVFIFSKAKSSVNPEMFDITVIQTTNSQLLNYEGKEVKGSTVKEFLNMVDILNAKDTFPIDIVAGEVTNYSFTATGDNITSQDRSSIKENSNYEIALQDKLPATSPDGYIDTYEIVAY